MLHLIWVLRGSMCMLQICEKLHGGVGLAELYGDVRFIGISMPNRLHRTFEGKTRCIK